MDCLLSQAEDQYQGEGEKKKKLVHFPNQIKTCRHLSKGKGGGVFKCLGSIREDKQTGFFFSFGVGSRHGHPKLQILGSMGVGGGGETVNKVLHFATSISFGGREVSTSPLPPPCAHVWSGRKREKQLSHTRARTYLYCPFSAMVLKKYGNWSSASSPVMDPSAL